MKYVLRTLASPFMLGLNLLAHNYFAFKRTFLFIRYGGEFIHYEKDEKSKIKDIYLKLSEESISTKEVLQGYYTKIGIDNINRDQILDLIEKDLKAFKN